MNSSIRLLKVLRPARILQNIRQQSNSTAGQWDLYASVCLQRLPVIGPEMNWLERRMSEHLSRVEVSESLYSNHEMRHFEDLKRTERIASGADVDEKDLEEAAKQNAVDFEEESLKELKNFTVASRATKADLTNNTKSVDRSLDKHLYLLTKQSIAGKDHWLFPSVAFSSENNSLRASAEQLLDTYFPLSSTGSPTIHKTFLGNAPAVLYSYRYPKELAESSQKLGARVFIFKVNLDPNQYDKHPALTGSFGERTLQPKGVQEYSWVTRSEMKEKVPAKYWNTVSSIVLPEVLVDLEKILDDGENKIARTLTVLQKFEAKYSSPSSSTVN